MLLVCEWERGSFLAVPHQEPSRTSARGGWLAAGTTESQAEVVASMRTSPLGPYMVQRPAGRGWAAAGGLMRRSPV